VSLHSYPIKVRVQETDLNLGHEAPTLTQLLLDINSCFAP